MKLIKGVYVCFLILFLQTPVCAQNSYRFRNYTINEGLSQSSVATIIEDDNHSIWIGTQDGLNRFDGKNFEVFTSEDTEGVESEYFKCSVKTKDGKIWFGTTNGITLFDPILESFKTFSVKGRTAFQIESLSVDESENIWVATTDLGLYCFDPIKKIFKSYTSLVKSKKVRALFCSLDDELFVLTEDLGVLRIDKGRSYVQPIKVNVPSLVPVITKMITQYEKGKILFGTNQGVIEYDLNKQKSNWKFLKLYKEHGAFGVSDVFKDENNIWYIATLNKGLFTIFPNGKIANNTQDVFQKNALLYNVINDLYQDASGTIWVGTDRGIASFDPKNKGFLGVGPSGDDELGLPSPGVWSFAEDVTGRYIYIGTDVGVSRLDRFSGKYSQFYKKKTTKSATGESMERAVVSIEVISKDHLLIGGIDGIYELFIGVGNAYEYKKLSFLTKEQQAANVSIYAIEKWKENQYFVASKGGVLLIDLANRKAQSFTHDPKSPKNTITKGACRVIYRDFANKLWFATSSGELNTLQYKNDKLEIHPYKYNANLLHGTKDFVTAICRISKNEFWLGTFGSGLIYWNEATKTIRSFTKKDGLPNNVVYCIVQDQKSKKLWLSTNKGLSCFDPINKKTRNYTEEEGLLSNEFNLGASLKSINGEIFFGGIYGYNYFNPSKLQLYNPNIKVVFSKLRLDKNWLKPRQKGSPLFLPLAQTDLIELKYKQRSFSIRFQASDLSNPDWVNYKYILEGANEGEVLIGNSNEIRFSALSPGEYRLKVFARMGEGPWGKEPAVLSIYIRSPFWVTWWFWSIIGLVVVVVIRIVVRKRIDSERIEQVRLEMKIAERTKEIRAQNEKIEKQRKLLEEEKNKVVEQQRLLQIEKDKTEKLLRNVIPESTADELISKGKVSARAYKTVSVLFTDFVGFTKVAEHMNPTELVSRLDVYFRKFDEIIVANNLEKIKTIGDAYMCAGGVPVRNNTNPIDTCLAALQIQEYMRHRKNDAIISNDDFWELRLGINTGEVTAGVIGSERLAFDVWGATVNHAQRMEMLGEPGKVTIAGSTFKHIEPYFECVFRGKAQTKSRGMIDMYTVERIKPELSVNGEGIYPNDRFHQIVNLHHYSSISYYKAEKHIMKVLEKGLSDMLHYHSIEHTKDVVRAVERLALMEGVTDEGLFLLKSAATYHDAGFVEQYEKNEPIGARLAEEILPKYGYSEQHIETIKELIYVTQIPHKPKNKLEEIMCDADLDYLGRDDFHEIADRLRRELREHGKLDSDRKWDEIQVDFLIAHRYFTETALRTRNNKKLKNIEEVKERLEKNEYPD